MALRHGKINPFTRSILTKILDTSKPVAILVLIRLASITLGLVGPSNIRLLPPSRIQDFGLVPFL